MKQKITFIGGGNMATSLIAGLIAQDYPANCITATDPDENKIKQLKQQYQINTFTDNSQAIADADIIVLAVKPQIMQPVCKNLAGQVKENQPLVISIAAGLLSKDIARWLGDSNVSLVRCMPNTPSLLGVGATGLYANPHVSDEQKQQAETILSAAGMTTWVDKETLLDAVTAVSGSGPAYYFLFIEAMIKAGEQLGLTSEQAKQLTIQTALGAARMACESDDNPATLREKVTSKGGTTEQALNTFNDQGLSQIIFNAMQAANNRAAELAEQLGKDED